MASWPKGLKIMFDLHLSHAKYTLRLVVRCQTSCKSLFNCWYCRNVLFVDSNGNNVHVAFEQHFTWCTLGFIRSIATGPAICKALSSPRWIDLLLKVLEEDRSPAHSKNITKQVSNQAWVWYCLVKYLFKLIQLEL